MSPIVQGKDGKFRMDPLPEIEKRPCLKRIGRSYCFLALGHKGSCRP